MCGITGIFALREGLEPDADTIERMTFALVHRGPDDFGYYRRGPVALGHRRLAIIDLDSGQQPIGNEDGSVQIIFNGEIYNFVELRERLEAKGHRFKTRTDTEAIIHLYEEKGAEMVEDLRGMFALAIWDGRKQELLLVRDRAGIKPLFYAERDGCFLFASELKAILSYPGFPRDLSYEGLVDYFTLLYPLAPHTIFTGIFELPPGHWMRVRQGGKETRKYWDLEYSERDIRSEEAAVEELESLLAEAVRLRLVSDVPLGCFLSGGVDSGTVTALMARAADEPVRSFSIGWGERESRFDERIYARMVAERYGTQHEEFVVEPRPKEVLPEIIRGFDQPFADASAIPNYYLCRETRKRVTVALSGLGGDEVCAGYERYRGGQLATRLSRIPKVVRDRLIRPVVDRIPDSSSGGHFQQRLKKLVQVMGSRAERVYFDLMARITLAERLAWLSPDLWKSVDPDQVGLRYLEHEASRRQLSPLNRWLDWDRRTYLPSDLLALTDRMSMLHALEVRVPFLDHKVMEWFAGISPDWKLRGRRKKYILTKVAEHLLPHEAVDRQKMGFSVPLVLWFRNELREEVRERLSRQELEKTGLFNPSEVQKMIEEHQEGRANHDERIWAVMVFMEWMDRCMGPLR